MDHGFVSLTRPRLCLVLDRLGPYVIIALAACGAQSEFSLGGYAILGWPAVRVDSDPDLAWRGECCAVA